VKFLILDEGDELLTPNFKVHWSESLSLCVCVCVHVCVSNWWALIIVTLQQPCCCQGLIWSGWRTMSVLLAGVTGGHLLLNHLVDTRPPNIGSSQPFHSVVPRVTLMQHLHHLLLPLFRNYVSPDFH